MTEMISALEGILSEYADNNVIATIVALIHLDIAWARRSTESIRDTPARNLEAFNLQSKRTQQVLDPFCGIELDSLLLTSARCALLVGNPNANDRVTNDYEDLIDLTPQQQRHIHALGHHIFAAMVWQLRLPRIGSAPNSLQNPRHMGGAGAYT